MSSIFDNRVFDVEKFVTMPKCTKSWNIGPAGCILTAFSYAFGVESNSGRINGLNSLGPNLKQEVNVLAESLGFNKLYPGPCYRNICIKQQNQNNDLCNEECINANYDFSNKVIQLYDRGQEIEALDMIWELIEKLPNKINCYSGKEQVILPESCKV
jgi:hypothetical protein